MSSVTTVVSTIKHDFICDLVGCNSTSRVEYPAENYEGEPIAIIPLGWSKYHPDDAVGVIDVCGLHIDINYTRIPSVDRRVPRVN